MPEIKTILFDLGNVLVNVDIARAAKTYSTFSKRKEEEFSHYIHTSRELKMYQEGKLTSSQFYAKTCRLFKMDIKFADFYDTWNSMFYPYPEMETIIKNIKKKYPHIKMILLSDTNEAHYTFIRKEYNILDLLDGFVLSFEVGKEKPHADMFKSALSLADTIPRDTFYTDDKAELTRAARVMGIRAFQFTGHEDLRETFRKCGLEV